MSQRRRTAKAAMRRCKTAHYQCAAGFRLHMLQECKMLPNFLLGELGRQWWRVLLNDADQKSCSCNKSSVKNKAAVGASSSCKVARIKMPVRYLWRLAICGGLGSKPFPPLARRLSAFRTALVPNVKVHKRVTNERELTGFKHTGSCLLHMMCTCWRVHRDGIM